MSEEALYFLTKGLQGLTEDHVLLLCETFDDGTGNFTNVSTVLRHFNAWKEIFLMQQYAIGTTD
jgi:hypothetical protein